MSLGRAVPKNYWIRQANHDAQGPFAEDTIRRYVKDGRVRGEMWFSEDGKEWLQGAQLPKLFPPVQRPRERTTTAGARAMRHAAKRLPPVDRTTRWKAVGLVGLALLVLIGSILLALPGDSRRRKNPIRGAPLTTAQVVARASESIAVVGDGFGQGTGFLIRDGILATNAHVTRSMFVRDIALSFGDGPHDEDLVLEILHDDGERDLCLLRVQTDRAPLEMAREDVVPPGTELLIIGNPGLGVGIIEKAVSRGLAGPLVDLEGVEFLQIGAAVNPGNSGGPVLDAEGLVVSVVTLKSRELDGVAFGVPASALRHALALVDVREREDRATLALRHDAAAALHRLTAVGLLQLFVGHASFTAAAIADSSGEAPLPVFLRSRLEASEQLSEARLMMRALQQHLERMARDDRLTRAHREHLGELWRVVARLEQCNLAPVEDVDALRQRMKDDAVLFEGLRASLKKDLRAMGVRFPEPGER